MTLGFDREGHRRGPDRHFCFQPPARQSPTEASVNLRAFFRTYYFHAPVPDSAHLITPSGCFGFSVRFQFINVRTLLFRSNILYIRSTRAIHCTRKIGEKRPYNYFVFRYRRRPWGRFVLRKAQLNGLSPPCVLYFGAWLGTRYKSQQCFIASALTFPRFRLS